MAQFMTSQDLTTVFNVPYYPGWKMFLLNNQDHSKKPIPVFQVQDYFTAAHLPAGDHRLFLIYDPASWKLALIITIVSVLLLG
jgi:uncharacterized membrane protein YfhO